MFLKVKRKYFNTDEYFEWYITADDIAGFRAETTKDGELIGTLISFKRGDPITVEGVSPTDLIKTLGLHVVDLI